MVAPCTITGDSIAVGLYPHLPCYMAYTKIGANSRAIARNAGDVIGTVIISSGSNDWKPTAKNFHEIRKKYEGQRVIWVLPGPKFKDAQEMIKSVAQEWGDSVLQLSGMGRDGIHPTGKGYKESAEMLKSF